MVSALLGGPIARARAGRPNAAPCSASGPARKAPRAARALRAGPHAYRDAAIAADAARNVDRRASLVEHDAVLDRQAVAIGRVARAPLRDDQHAPVAVETGSRGARRARQRGTRSEGRSGDAVGEKAGGDHGYLAAIECRILL